jgi:hypothetical protein
MLQEQAHLMRQYKLQKLWKQCVCSKIKNSVFTFNTSCFPCDLYHFIYYLCVSLRFETLWQQYTMRSQAISCTSVEFVSDISEILSLFPSSGVDVMGVMCTYNIYMTVVSPSLSRGLSGRMAVVQWTSTGSQTLCLRDFPNRRSWPE